MTEPVPAEEPLPACWTRCTCCDDFWCNVHDEHAFDCVCPVIDVWAAQGLSSYNDSDVPVPPYPDSEED